MDFYLDRVAAATPDKAALIVEPSGASLSYAQLARRAATIAHWIRACGVAPGEHVAWMLPNGLPFLELAFGAQRAGVYFTPVPVHLKAAEAAHILRDCGAKLFIVDAAFLDELPALREASDAIAHRYTVGGAREGFAAYGSALDADDEAAAPGAPWEGVDFLYSSGTTGLPKAVKFPLTDGGKPIDHAARTESWRRTLGWGDATIYLSTAPLYHAAPLRYAMRTVRFGGTAVIMEKFDAGLALALIERHRVTHSQWVPAMFVRLIDLPEAVRSKHDLSSHRVAVHAAAPCPIPLKEAMLAWWGNILWEYYAGSEGNGLTMIGPEEWLTHRGSVGRAITGRLQIMDESGERQLPAGEVGAVYFAGGYPFEYHNDPEKTRGAYNAQGASTLGDIGYVDAEGYLYLTDRKAFMIISGGVNVYPQEVENLLVGHPRIADAAVFGVPNRELGEEVKAVVQLRNRAEASPALAKELIDWCRERLSKIKSPRSIDFVDELPRSPTGKLLKRELKTRYHAG